LRDEIHTGTWQPPLFSRAQQRILPLLAFDELAALEPPVSLCDRPTDIFQFLE
jgi:hypothetical protein